MRIPKRAAVLGLVVVGCGGESIRVDDGTGGQGGVGGAAATGGSSGTTGGGRAAGGGSAGGAPGGDTGGVAAMGGVPEAPERIGLGDGDEADDGRPVVPTDSTGAFFWGGCGDGGWRIGNWFVTTDRVTDGFLRPIEPPRDESTLARGASGGGFPAGVVLWIELNHPFGSAVGLEGCSGIEFWGRLEGASDRLLVALNDGSYPSGLPEGRSILPSRTLAVGSEWQAFTLPFSSFPLEGVSVDGLSLASIEFFVGEGGGSFDLWIDDLALVCPNICSL